MGSETEMVEEMNRSGKEGTLLENRSQFTWHLPPGWLGILVAIILILGIFFRFANLDGKYYWIDETYTSLRVSGYTEAELVRQTNYNQIVDASYFQKFQTIGPEKGLNDTLNSLAQEDPQHPPLYYVLARFWSQLFGSSITAMRALPAVISLLAFPAVYWLCWELFQSTLTGWIAIALLAISPYHLLFAQEARQYSLWTVLTLLSSAALLRAIRATESSQNPLSFVPSWVIYILTATAGLYTHLLFVCVIAAHGLYVIAIENWRTLKNFFAYYLAAFVTLLLFIPSLINVIENRKQVTSTTLWLELSDPLRLVIRWIGAVCVAFLDFGLDGKSSATQLALFVPPTLAVLALVGYAIYFLCKTTPKRVWLLVLLLIATIALFLALPDLLQGGRRSANPRYLVPLYVGVHVAVAYLLSAKITSSLTHTRQQKLWQVGMLVLISLGILSNVMISQAETWWNKGSGWLGTDLEVARILNQAKQPLLIGDVNIAYLMPLSHRLDPSVKMEIDPYCYTSCYKNPDLRKRSTELPQIPNGFQEVFVLRPSKTLLARLQEQKNYKLEPVSQSIDLHLWKVNRF